MAERLSAMGGRIDVSERTERMKLTFDFLFQILDLIGDSDLRFSDWASPRSVASTDCPLPAKSKSQIDQSKIH
jgi:hypothetical protein